MSSAEHAESADFSAKSRQKRSRTGCLTCRNRRRKCDEGKPQCQNCISKGFECRYGAVFQILGKNNYTPKGPSKGGYTELQRCGKRFGILCYPRIDNTQADGIKPFYLVLQPELAYDADELKFVSEFGKRNDGEDIEQHEKDDEETQVEGTSRPLLSAGPQSTSPQNDQSTEQLQDTRPHSSSAERYEFALHGLLALGSANGSDIGEPAVNYASMIFSETDQVTLSSPTGVSVDQFQTVPHVANNGEFHAAPKFQSWPSMSGISPAESLPITDECVLEYLKHYRYNIAPWMDICDMNQFFGCEMLQLSKAFSPIQLEILALAEASLSARQFQNAHADILTRMQRQEDVLSDKVHQALLDALGTVKVVVTNLSEFWNQQDSAWCTQHVLEPLLSEVNGKPGDSIRPLAPAVFWLMARLQLSVALMSLSTIKIPLPTASISAWEYVSAGNAERVSRYAHDAIALCIDATIFSRGDEDRWLQQQYGLDRVDLWKTLVAGFERWYKHRPQNFQPIIELYPRDGGTSEDGFPTLVFSSGANALANQLYHTGMLLLLQNKPRFISQISQSPSMSALWHAHRVCGISLSNDRWDCWDPSLVASLLVAAKTVTHQSQHKAILNTLETIQQLTGWNISHHVEQLAFEWQQANGW